MKTRLLIIIATITISLFGYTQYVDAICMENQDWSDAPCYGCIGCYPGLEQEKIEWEPYYDYKGSMWMNAKKIQLETAIHNSSLREWFEQSDNQAHKNVHKYYFLQGDVPNIYGMNFDEALGFERAWNAVEDSSPDAPLLLWNYHDVIFDGTLIETDLAVTITGDHVPLYHINVNQYFKGEKNSDMITAVENPDDLEFDLFENGLFYLKKMDGQNWYTATIASTKTFGNCDARDLIEINPVLPNEKPARSAPILPEGFVDPCVPNYYDVDPDGNKSVYSLEIDTSLYSLKQQIKKGWNIESLFCHDEQVLILKITDESPACVKLETKTKLIQRGWAEPLDDIIKQRTVPFESESVPEPPPETDVEIQLYNAKKTLQNAYHNQLNLGAYYMKDVIVGFGTYDDTLIIDIPSKYTDQNSIQEIKKEIRHIVGDKVKIDYAVYDEPIERHISTVIPYLWNKILHQKQIEFAPKNQGYGNNADGFKQHDKVCSPLVTSNGTEFYISSTFDYEPFEITGTFIDKIEPEGCHKIWKTDMLMAEPNRVTALWLENEN